MAIKLVVLGVILIALVVSLLWSSLKLFSSTDFVKQRIYAAFLGGIITAMLFVAATFIIVLVWR